MKCKNIYFAIFKSLFAWDKISANFKSVVLVLRLYHIASALRNFVEFASAEIDYIYNTSAKLLKNLVV